MAKQRPKLTAKQSMLRRGAMLQVKALDVMQLERKRLGKPEDEKMANERGLWRSLSREIGKGVEADDSVIDKLHAEVKKRRK